MTAAVAVAMKAVGGNLRCRDVSLFHCFTSHHNDIIIYSCGFQKLGEDPKEAHKTGRLEWVQK